MNIKDLSGFEEFKYPVILRQDTGAWYRWLGFNEFEYESAIAYATRFRSACRVVLVPAPHFWTHGYIVYERDENHIAKQIDEPIPFVQLFQPESKYYCDTFSMESLMMAWEQRLNVSFINRV